MTQIYLVPLAQDRYELYFEMPATDAPDEPVDRPSSWWRRTAARFRRVLAEAEEQRRRREMGERGPGGLWHATLRRLAEAVAEQRLLWHLRHVDAATLWHADDVPAERALQMLRASLDVDLKKHRRWMVIDALLWVASLPLTVLPGPNVPALYFSFRAIGHYLAYAGARQGRSRIAWTASPSSDLSAVRTAIALPRAARVDRLTEISAALGLGRLAAFVERTRG